MSVARIVCQVLHRPDRVTFIWSQGSTSFPPYHLRGEKLNELRRLADQARREVARLAGDSGTVRELMAAGERLFQTIFSAADPAPDVLRWWTEQHQQGPIESLEITCDVPAAIPWNVVFERSADVQSDSPEAIRSFWGAAHGITENRRVNGLRHVAVIPKPRVLLVVDPQLRAALDDQGRSLLAEFMQTEASNVAESRSQLEICLEASPADFTYVFCRASESGIALGQDMIPWHDIAELLKTQDAGKPAPIVFLNIGRENAVAPGCLLDPLLGMGLDGLIANEFSVSATAANAFGLDFLRRFLREGRRLGHALQESRAASGPIGLLYRSFCPGHLHVTRDDTAEEETDGEFSSYPLPDHPYRPLAPYDQEQRALFVGRDEDTASFANLLDRGDARLILLHGTAGVGKSSFVRAGLVPYLEEDAIGFRFLRDRTAGDEPVPEEQYPVLAIRTSADLAGQIAEALCAFCDQPFSFTTPAGATRTVDLPAILKVHAQPRSEPASTAIRSAGGSGPIEPPVEEHRDQAEDAKVTAGQLWEAMQDDPACLACLLEALSDPLPFELVVLIEQGEDAISLVNTPAERRRRRLAFQMLAHAAVSVGKCKFILSLRTEFLGRILDQFPHERAYLRQFLLGELSEDALVEAILRPTEENELPYADEVPYEKYQFSFEDGVARSLVQELLKSGKRRESALHSLQAVCAQLYDKLSGRQERVISNNDYLKLTRPGLEHGGLLRYVDRLFNRGSISDRAAARKLFSYMLQWEPGGGTTRKLMRVSELKSAWVGRGSPDAFLDWASSDEIHLLEWRQLLIGGKEGTYASLTCDGIHPLVPHWEQRASLRSRTADLLWIFFPLIFLAVAVTWYFIPRTQAAGETEEEKTLEKQIKEAFFKGQTVAQLSSARALSTGQLAQARLALECGNMLRMRQLLLSYPLREDEHRGWEWYYLWRQGNLHRHMLVGHRGPVTSVAITGDGRRLASASNDGSVHVWDAASGLIVAVLSGHKGSVNAVAFSSDGKSLATAGEDGTVRLWDVPATKDFIEQAKARQVLSGHVGAILAVTFLSGPALASSGADKSVILWDLTKGEKRQILKEHAGPVRALAADARGQLLASAGEDRAIHIWDATSGAKKQSLHGHTGPVDALAFSPDGRVLASAGTERQDTLDVGRLLLWDLDTGKPKSRVTAHALGVFTIAFGPEGKWLVTGGKDNMMRVWMADSAEFVKTLPGHLGWVRSVAVSRDGSLMVSGSFDQKVKTWETQSALAPDVLRGHKDWVNTVAFAPAGRILASGSKDGTVKLWDAVHGRLLETLAVPGGSVQSVAFTSIKGTYFLAAGTWEQDNQGVIKIWEVTANKTREVQTIKTAGVAGITFSPDSKLLASGGGNASVFLWDWKEGKKLHTLAGHKGTVRCVAFAPDGATLASGGDDGNIITWRPTTGQKVDTSRDGHTGPVNAIAYLPEKNWLASAGQDQTVRIWRNMQSSGTHRGHGHAVLAIAVSPALDPIVSGGWEGTIKSWDLGEGTEERFTFFGHGGPVRALTISSDGLLMASASHDGTIRLWRAAMPSRKP
jgi:WD40 repeat protein